MPDQTIEELTDRLNYLRPQAARATELELQLQQAAINAREEENQRRMLRERLTIVEPMAEAFRMLEAAGMTGDVAERAAELGGELQKALDWMKVMRTRVERNAPLFKVKGEDGERERIVEIEFFSGLTTRIDAAEATLAVPVDD